MKRILIDYIGNYVRTALMEDGELVEIIINAKKKESIVGNIYSGVVKTILPSQFAFVDIGADKNAFLNLNDGKERDYAKAIKQGQEILVQVVNDASGLKGSHISTQIHLSDSIAVIFKSNNEMIGISHRIQNSTRREQLKHIALSALPPGYSAVLRTASESKTDNEITAAIGNLLAQYHQIIEHSRYVKGPALVYKENYILRELITEDIDEIIINDGTELTSVKTAADRFITGFGNKVFLYEEKQLLFDAYNIENDIDKALDTNVWLKSGGFLIIEQTETCVVIDVNTGKFAGHKNHRDTIMKTNLEAADEITRQIRLRNLSGIIIIDFIDLINKADKSELYSYFARSLKKDRLKTHIAGLTKLGLMMLTRMKTREPLEKILTKKCETCHSLGRVPSPEYLADITLREQMRGT